MNKIKKILGLFCMLLAPLIIAVLVYGAFTYIDSKGGKDINNPVVWVIIISIFTPIAMGLSIFGWYAFSGAYAEEHKI